jgi:hypothetical protein
MGSKQSCREPEQTWCIIRPIEEFRFLTMGYSKKQRLIVVAHTERDGKDNMSQGNNPEPKEEMREEYDFSSGVRGKYYKQYMKGTNVVLLEPDVAEVFRDSESVNQALRVLISIAKKQVPQPR